MNSTSERKLSGENSLKDDIVRPSLNITEASRSIGVPTTPLNTGTTHSTEPTETDESDTVNSTDDTTAPEIRRSIV